MLYFPDECVKFIIQLGKDVGLQVQVINVEIKKPIVILSLIGNNPELPSVLLNSHMDVVPVDPVSKFFLSNNKYRIILLYEMLKS